MRPETQDDRGNWAARDAFAGFSAYRAGNRLDEDDFWLTQPEIINLIALKVIEQLSGFK